jgi:hypothetical protein
LPGQSTEQIPFPQTYPLAHIVPGDPPSIPHPADAPQYVRLVSGLTHVPPQFVSPGAHDAWHVLFEQTSPASHALPHAPQFCGSLVVSRQLCPHFVVPPEHVSAHVPFEQTCPLAHAFAHFPQFAGSLSRSAHDPEQFVAPGQTPPSPTVASSDDVGFDPFCQHVLSTAQW